MANLKVAGLDIGTNTLTVDKNGTLLVNGTEVSGGGGISYVWLTETERIAQAGMSKGEQGIQQDTNIVYKYDGTNWVEYYKTGSEYPEQTGNAGKFLMTTGENVEWSDVALSNYYTKEDTDGLLDTKQDTLVSGTSIKTINGKSVLGNGDLDLEGLSTLSSPKLNEEVLTERRHVINGKPIYVKTIDFGALPNNTMKNVPHTITGYDYIGIDATNTYTYIPGVVGFSYSGVASVWNNKIYDVGMYIDGNNISLATGTNRTNMKAYVTVEYTKSTDTTESPVRLVGGGSGETDLSNYYTKPQVDEFINEINAELGSTGTLGEYGLKWDQETDVYEILGATNRTQIQRNMKRCVLNDDGTVNYYLNPTNSILKAQGGTAVLTGADGNVMVEVPKFWYKHTLVGDTHEWWVSNTPLEGYSVHPWFLEGGVERPFRYYRAYTPTVVGGKLRSISGSTPTKSQTRSTFRTQARANGTGWELCSWNAVNAIQLLFLTEYCTFNTQAVLGRGNDISQSYGITTGQSNNIGNASSGATNNNTWMSYRGIENWYADCWEFIDGINVQNYKVFLNQNPTTFADNIFIGDYVDSGVTLPAMNNTYIKKISGNFLPTAVGGSSSTFVTDGGWSSAGGTLVFFGGAASWGLSNGGFTFEASYSAGASVISISAGLSR